MISTSHPEYRLVLSSDQGAAGIAPHVQAAIDHLGPWREISEQAFDCADAEHLEAVEDIAVQGAHLRMLTAGYIGRVEVKPAP